MKVKFLNSKLNEIDKVSTTEERDKWLAIELGDTLENVFLNEPDIQGHKITFKSFSFVSVNPNLNANIIIVKDFDFTEQKYTIWNFSAERLSAHQFKINCKIDMLNSFPIKSFLETSLSFNLNKFHFKQNPTLVDPSNENNFIYVPSTSEYQISTQPIPQNSQIKVKLLEEDVNLITASSSDFLNNKVYSTKWYRWAVFWIKADAIKDQGGNDYSKGDLYRIGNNGIRLEGETSFLMPGQPIVPVIVPLIPESVFSGANSISIRFEVNPRVTIDALSNETSGVVLAYSIIDFPPHKDIVLSFVGDDPIGFEWVIKMPDDFEIADLRSIELGAQGFVLGKNQPNKTNLGFTWGNNTWKVLFNFKEAIEDEQWNCEQEFMGQIFPFKSFSIGFRGDQSQSNPTIDILDLPHIQINDTVPILDSDPVVQRKWVFGNLESDIRITIPAGIGNNYQKQSYLMTRALNLPLSSEAWANYTYNKGANGAADFYSPAASVATGAALGAVVGGPVGSLIGTTVGAVVSTGSTVLKRQQIKNSPSQSVQNASSLTDILTEQFRSDLVFLSEYQNKSSLLKDFHFYGHFWDNSAIKIPFYRKRFNWIQFSANQEENFSFLKNIESIFLIEYFKALKVGFRYWEAPSEDNHPFDLSYANPDKMEIPY